MAATMNQISVANAIDTSDNTWQEIATLATTADAGGSFTISIVAVKKSNSATKAWKKSASYKDVGGSLVTNLVDILSTQGTLADLLALELTDIRVVASTNSISIQVKGLSSTDMMWACALEGIEVYNL